MLKKIVTINIMLISLSLCLFAQVTKNIEKSGGFARIQAMGSNPYVIDPTNMTLNPAWGAYYDNFIFGDLGATQTTFGNDGVGQFVGANFRVNSQLTIGALLTRNDFAGTFSIGQLDPGDIVGQINNAVGAGITDLNNNFELMASLKSGSHKFGLGIAYASSSRSSNPAGGSSTEASASQIGFNLGYLGAMRGGILLDLSFSIVLPSASSKPPTASETSFSQTNIGVSTRAFFDLSQKFKFVPAFMFQSSSGSADIATGTQGTTSSDLNSTSIIVVGAGIMYESGDFLFAGGPAIASVGVTTPKVDNVSPELTTSTTLFPVWNLGAEWGMLDWLYARFGYVSMTGSISTESAATSTTVNESGNTFYGPTGAFVGLGFKLGNLSIDGTVNSDVLRQGLANIGGVGATFAYLSISIELK